MWLQVKERMGRRDKDRHRGCNHPGLAGLRRPFILEVCTDYAFLNINTINFILDAHKCSGLGTDYHYSHKKQIIIVWASTPNPLALVLYKCPMYYKVKKLRKCIFSAYKIQRDYFSSLSLFPSSEKVSLETDGK